MNMKKINFKQPKYIIPTIAYFGLLLLGWLFIDLFTTEVDDGKPSDLQTTEYLNSDLPAANVAQDIGSKRKNVRDVFGDITDRSAVQDIIEDADTTTKKKEAFETQYSEEELKRMQELEAQQEEIKRLREMNDRLKRSATRGELLGSTDFVVPMTDEERERVLAQRRSNMLADLDRDLGNVRGRGVADLNAVALQEDSIRKRGVEQTVVINEDAVRELPENAESHIVVKKAKADSEFFNTLSSNQEHTKLIKAIIDEEVKVVEGSRVRLRLLDDIDIDGTTLPKGSYLYATMSGFSQQRVKGSISSILVGDEILKISMSLYDTSDGLEGLYVPGSNFRETAKEIGSSAMQGNLQMNTATGGNNFTQWAGQALQNGVQRTTNAISKAIKKNRVRLKYGTQVYLVNSKTERRR